ncbi:thiolase-like protein [Pleurotus eryngii]|uniref:Thiolase-like protein n=1 Tax=Pleurotus eryngii TaxID=5323 RepID=A0A9P6D614_PLEER|nr:thiolase-like protein [Pleurotus eryngii]
MASSIPLLGSLDLVCAVGVSCRLPGEVMRPDALWDILGSEYQRASSSSLPHSREFASYKPGHSIPNHKGQWLGAAEPEAIDAFFGIRDTDAATLHPNTRLSLELTQEALESTGIPPSSLRGKNVAVIVGVSNADGRGMKRSQYTSSAPSASHHSWATSSDPSGIAGHISYLFDFCGISSTVSNVCDGGALAIHNGVLALQQGNADIAIICAIATHVAPSAFASSPDANGYPPVEGAVFFILKPLSAGRASGDAVLGIIRGIALRHYDSTRSLNTSSVEAHIEVAERAMLNANVDPHDIALVEVHDAEIPPSQSECLVGPPASKN